MRQAARMYRETQVTTTSQGQVLIMLYDGAIKFLTQAKEYIKAKDCVNKGLLISNAIDIINELASSLNAEKGGDLAANLNQLYFYCNKRLFMANLRMDIAPIDEVIKILGGIRSAYAQIIDTPEAIAAMEQAAASVAASGKGPRTPLGVHSAPVGAPVQAAKVRTAYAVQNIAVAPQIENSALVEPVSPVREVPVATTVAVPEPQAAEPVEMRAAPMPGLVDFPDLTPLPPAQGKRLAGYHKFAS